MKILWMNGQEAGVMCSKGHLFEIDGSWGTNITTTPDGLDVAECPFCGELDDSRQRKEADEVRP